MATFESKFFNGDKVRDRISGFEGIVVCVSHWYNGCVRIQVEATTLNKDGQKIPMEAFDEAQLDLAQVEHIAPTKTSRTGGDQPMVTRSPDASRE